MLFNSQEGCGLVVVSGVWACDDVKDEQGWAAIGVFLSRVRARELYKDEWAVVGMHAHGLLFMPPSPCRCRLSFLPTFLSIKTWCSGNKTVSLCI